MSQINRYELRYDMVKHALNYGKKEASREYKTSPHVVRKWVRRYQKEGIKKNH